MKKMEKMRYWLIFNVFNLLFKLLLPFLFIFMGGLRSLYGCWWRIIGPQQIIRDPWPDIFSILYDAKKNSTPSMSIILHFEISLVGKKTRPRSKADTAAALLPLSDIQLPAIMRSRENPTSSWRPATTTTSTSISTRTTASSSNSIQENETKRS